MARGLSDQHRAYTALMATLQNTMVMQLHAEPSLYLHAKLIRWTVVRLRVSESVYRTGLSAEGPENVGYCMLCGCLFGRHDSHYSHRTLATLCYSPLYEYIYGHCTLMRCHGFGVVSC